MLGINISLQQNRYRIIQQFGQNELTASYEAYDNVLKTNVVIKEILVNLKKVSTAAQQESRKLAFANEAKTLTELKHDSLLHVHDYFSEIDGQYLVIESVEGKDLGELIEKNKKPVSLMEMLRWADQLLDALSYLHSQTPPVIHRDIKPQNIKLNSDGKIKLLTFDITKKSSSKALTAITNQTFDETVLNFLPLELIWGGLDPASQKVILNSYDETSEKILEQPADVRSDIYALGATLYYLATAQMPLDPLERSIDTLEGKPDPLPTPNQLNPAIPREISDILMKSLEIRREHRFDSAVIMRHILRATFGQLKQNEAEKAKKREAENKLAEDRRLEEERKIVEQKRLAVEAEQKQLEQERQLIEQKKLELEAEQKRQAELIQNQLREAEAQRLKAEQLAAEAEKRLIQKEGETNAKNEVFELDFNEVLELDNAKPLAETPNTSTSFAKESNSTKIESKSDEINDLFAVPPKENKMMRQVVIALAVFAVLGGAAWGVWAVMLNKPVSTDPAISTQVISANDKALPSPSPEPTTATVETTKTETSAIPTDSPTTQPIVNQTVYKKPVVAPTPAPTQFKKPVIATAAKTPTIQKKSVTVDDIINGN